MKRLAQLARALAISAAALAAPATAEERKVLSLAFTKAETLPISARPANCGLSKAITLPISCGDWAPLPAMALLTAVAISASVIGCGI